MNDLYHGSIIPNIKQLSPCSLLHGTDKKVVYLTDNIPYALFYIWDKEHNHSDGKHVTAWIKDGTVNYEEQFPDQMKVFYEGVSGYMYTVSYTPDIEAMDNRECLYFAPHNVTAQKCEYISDVYKELLKYETAGKLKVRRYNEQSEQRQNELTEMIAAAITKDNCFNDKAKSEFYKRYFVKAWEKAKENIK